MTNKINFPDLSQRIVPAPTNDISNVKYHYVASFIVDLRHEPDYCIMDRKYLTVNGDFNQDCYHSECVSNAELSHFLETEITGRLVDSKIVNGVFRLVYAVTCDGSEWSGPDGTEYDAWENYELLTKTELSEEEIEFLLKFGEYEDVDTDQWGGEYK